MIKWIISDMDGTLLIDHNRLPDDFDEVMEMLKQKNIMFSPASGRQYQAKWHLCLPTWQRIILLYIFFG